MQSETYEYSGGHERAEDSERSDIVVTDEPQTADAPAEPAVETVPDAHGAEEADEAERA